MHDIHDYAAVFPAEKIRFQKGEMLEINKQAIFDFVEISRINGVGIPRVLRYFSVLKWASSTFDKDFHDVTKQDVVRLIGALQDSSRREWTKTTYKAILRKFFKWLKGNNEFYPPEVSWIKGHPPRNKIEGPKREDLLIEDDLPKLLDACQNLRDKALVSLLWESGARIGEIGSMSVGSLTFDKMGGIATLQGKTGQRTARVINAVPHLANWLSVHPHKNDKASPLWICLGSTNTGQLMKYATFRKTLRNVFDRAGIQKRANPHNFRHSRSTFLADHLTEFQMNHYLGWVQGSKMPSTYVHLSGKKTDETLLKLYGMQADDKNAQEIQKPIRCFRCETINETKADFCMKCGAVLTVGAAVGMTEKAEASSVERKNADSLMNQLMQDPEFVQFLSNKVKKMG